MLDVEGMPVTVFNTLGFDRDDVVRLGDVKASALRDADGTVYPVQQTENGAVAGLVIGLTLTLVHILGIALTGTSVNPARSIGSAVFAGGEALKNVWVFIVAPLAGGVLAAITYKFLSKEQ